MMIWLNHVEGFFEMQNSTRQQNFWLNSFESWARLSLAGIHNESTTENVLRSSLTHFIRFQWCIFYIWIYIWKTDEYDGLFWSTS